MKSDQKTSCFSKGFHFFGLALLWICLGAVTLWAILALWIDVPVAWLRSPAVSYAVGSVLAGIFLRSPWKVRSLGLGFLVVLGWWLSLRPSNQRDWQEDVAVLPFAEIHGSQVTLHEIRDCDYRSETDYEVRHYDRSVDLDQLQSVDLFLVTWGSPDIAHTMVSFGFADGSFVCFSIETRKEKGEAYSAIKGLFRQFEITYVIADERDLVRLRTSYRQGEEVYLYRLQLDPEKRKKMFLGYLQRVNALHQRPEWYHAIMDNCTTAIRMQQDVADRIPWDWRILLNGHLDELLYERGKVFTDLPFEELKNLSHINERAKGVADLCRFSQEIRQGLPGFATGATPEKKRREEEKEGAIIKAESSPESVR